MHDAALDTVLGCMDYISAEGFESYDYSDLWASPVGRRLKNAAYRTEPWGNLLFASPLIAAELWFPQIRRLCRLPKRVFPITIAHHGLSCLELYQTLGGAEFLLAARDAAARLLDATARDSHGLCWGFPFDWPTNAGLVPADTPAATQTSYAFDLLDGLHGATGDSRYLTALESVTRAMVGEYQDLERSCGLASTYFGGSVGGVVTNAITYRIHMLARGSQLTQLDYVPLANRLADYVLWQQRSDGAWVYGESEKNGFVDHFHTCFVLKNLRRANVVLQRSDVVQAVEKGLAFYWRCLFDDSKLPKPFAQTVRMNIVRYESYDFAEHLGLFSAFGSNDGFSMDRLGRAVQAFRRLFILPSGAFRFRRYGIPARAGVPYYRYGMTAALYALAKLLNGPLAEKRSS